MITKRFSWTLSHVTDGKEVEGDTIPARVPGSIGLDYATAKNYPPYYYEKNYELFRWMEDEYFLYKTTLDFKVEKGEYAYLHFGGVDYEFDITVGGKTLHHGKGSVTPVALDVTEFSGKNVPLEVLIYPIPKAPDAPRKNTRDEQRESFKSASSYGWDWHPRLVPSGIFDDVRLEIHAAAPLTMDASYRMSDALDRADVSVKLDTVGIGTANISLIAPDGSCAFKGTVPFSNDSAEIKFSVDNPALWYPRGYGDQPLYTLTAECNGVVIKRKIGFRRVKLLRNYDDKNPAENSFPKSRYPAPATIEVNGVRVFAKGSNFVSADIFQSLITDERYKQLLDEVVELNMNILRMWGGGFIYRDAFYEMCDERGIMVWQEFTLSCNTYPDKDEYLDLLKQEATTLIKRVRTHPCLVLWCGGNELFNSWSGMTDQSHPLRLLNALCFELDRFTPFNATSPLEGMGHGTYTTLFIKKAAKEDKVGLGGTIEITNTEEFITVLCRSYFTAYTEFGSAGCASPEYIKKYIMSEKDYLDFGPKNPIWCAHHAFGSWGEDCWARPNEIDYYFGGYESVDDFMEKSLAVQAISYKSLFEEMRRQWPHCSMAINWDLNEPWPCAAGNSLLNWPCERKPAFYAVKDALRPTIASIKTGKNRYLKGETLCGEIWVLNDSGEALGEKAVKITAIIGDKRLPIGEVTLPECPARSNRAAKVGIELKIADDFPALFHLELAVEGAPEMNSKYTFIAK